MSDNKRKIGIQLLGEGTSYDVLVKNLLVHIVRTDEGVVVDIFAHPGEEDANESIASTYAFFNEATGDDQEESNNGIHH